MTTTPESDTPSALRAVLDEKFYLASGPSDAPIVLVEYTDYQCPYCSRVQPTITALLERYEGKIKHVFKDLPLPIHAEAELAGEAAHCAGDQE